MQIIFALLLLSACTIPEVWKKGPGPIETKEPTVIPTAEPTEAPVPSLTLPGEVKVAEQFNVRLCGTPWIANRVLKADEKYVLGTMAIEMISKCSILSLSLNTPGTRLLQIVEPDGTVKFQSQILVTQ